ncbi:hypothetical protein LCGC14_2359560 [marine sediment metagenome]|uniref:Uncharacterized protein n=1 Tax=marine sediment metagenome TaxID=412755 RepID=A0A0F9EJH0_9ZZZZ
MNKYLKEIYLAVLRDERDIKVIGNYNGSYTLAIGPHPNGKDTGAKEMYVLTGKGIVKPKAPNHHRSGRFIRTG